MTEFNRLNANTDMNLLVHAIDDNFQQINAEQETKVWNNDKGQQQMIFGKLPNGSYGILFFLDAVPHIIITAETGMVTATPGTSVFDVI